MKKTSLDIDKQNPRRWLLYIFIFLAVSISVFLVYKVVLNLEKQSEKVTVENFNRDFETYKGTQPGTFVGLLFDRIIINNQKYSDKQVSVSFDGIISSNAERIRDFKKKLNDFNYYEIIFEYNDAKYIKKIIVEDLGSVLPFDKGEDKDLEKEVSALIFNTGFELLSSLDNGSNIKSIIDMVIDRNDQYPEHQIIINFNSKDYDSSEELAELKSMLNDFLEYETYISYDASGYINQLDIIGE